jgi:hypothetical protein
LTSLVALREERKDVAIDAEKGCNDLLFKFERTLKGTPPVRLVTISNEQGEILLTEEMEVSKPSMHEKDVDDFVILA